MSATAQTSAKRRNAILAAIAGATLLIGGSTYALWYVSDGFGTDSSITAGDLNVAVGDSNAWDMSGDLVATGSSVITEDNVTLTGLTGVSIDPATFKVVPGDTVALTFPIKVTMSGDNLVASLTISGVDTLGTTGTFAVAAGALKNVSLSYQLFDSTGAAMAGYTSALPVGDDDALVGYFTSAASLPIDVTLDPTVPVTYGATSPQSVTLVLYVNFDKNTDKVDDTNAVLAISDALSATLTQVR